MRAALVAAALLWATMAPHAAHGQLVRLDHYQDLTGDRLVLHSAILGQDREVLVGLPRGFRPDTAHPVVVILDGEVLFDVVAPLTRLMADVGEIPPSVVVGIPVRGREIDFAPSIAGVPESGGADRILAHLRAELFPLLDSLYNIGPHKILWGHSAVGGLFCTYALLGPDTQFTGVVSSSPNLGFVREYTDPAGAFTQLAAKHGIFYYLTFGGEEGPDYMGGMFDRVQGLASRLEREAPANLIWKYQFYEGNNHFTNAIETYIDGLTLYFARIKQPRA